MPAVNAVLFEDSREKSVPIFLRAEVLKQYDVFTETMLNNT